MHESVSNGAVKPNLSQVTFRGDTVMRSSGSTEHDRQVSLPMFNNESIGDWSSASSGARQV